MTNKRKENFIILPEGRKHFSTTKPRVRVYEAEDDKDKEARKKQQIRNTNAQSYLMGAFETLHMKLESEKNSHIISYTGPPSHLVSKLSNPEKTSKFIDASSAELSMLTPRLEFFWVLHEQGNPVPTIEKFLFSDHVLKDQMVELQKPKEAGGNIVLESRSTIGTDVGVKEFTWMWDNKHSGDKTLKASVTIQFGSIKELLNERYLRFIFTKNTVEEIGKSGSEENETKTPKAKLRHTIKARYQTMGEGQSGAHALKLITKRSSEKPMEAKGVNYTEIKVVVGWAKPDIKPGGVVTKDFLDSIESTQRTILLGFSKYNLTFGAEGQVTLKIEYVGTLDSLLSDADAADVFAKTLTGAQATESPLPRSPEYKDEWFDNGATGQNPYKETAFGYNDDKKSGSGVTLPDGTKGWGILARQLVAGEEAETVVNFGGDSDLPAFNFTTEAADYEEATLRMHLQYLRDFERGGDEDIVKKLNDGIATVRSVRSRLRAREAYARHSEFIKELYSKGNLKYVTVKPSEISGSVGGARAAGAKINTEQVTMGTVGNDLVPKALSGQMIKNIQYNAATAAAKGDDEVKGNVAGKMPALNSMGRLDAEPDGEKEATVTVYFITLGHLLDVSISHLKLLEKIDSRIILGSFDGSETGLPISKPGPPFYSVADIPISIDWFGQWFLDNFTGISPPMQQLSVRQYMNKILEELVAPLINSAFETEELQSKMTFSMTSFAFPKKRNAKEITTENQNEATTVIKRGARIGKDAITKVAAHGADLSGQTAAQSGKAAKAEIDDVSYFVVFAAGQDKKTLKGSPTQDTKNGIYHLYIGADKGLVKSFSFSEKKMPHLRAMHVENNAQGSALILPQDVELTMIGNTFFRNGNLVYINADFALGSEVASRLGIGGYYLVVKSDNVINPSKFETVLTCMYHSAPYKEKKNK